MDTNTAADLHNEFTGVQRHANSLRFKVAKASFEGATLSVPRDFMA